jgi:hypothetical protein
VTISATPTQVSGDVSLQPVERVSAPLRELLIWVDRCPRSYAEAMDAWQSHCPRFTVWEDALAADLIEIIGGYGMFIGPARVQLTARGSSRLTQI